MTRPPDRVVLIVAAEEDLRSRLAALIKSHGTEVVEARDPELGLARAAQVNPNLVMLASRFPDHDGLAFLSKFREQGAQVIVCGVDDSDSERHRAREAGAADFIHAKFHPDELLARIRMTLSPGPQSRRTARDLQSDAVDTIKVLSHGTRTRSRASLDRENAVIDSNTGLPQTTALFREVKSIIEYTGQMTILYIRCPNNPLIEETFGWETASGILRDIAEAASDLLPDLAADQGRGLIAYGGGDDFIIFLGGERGDLAELLDSRHAVLLARRISTVIREKWSSEVAEIFDVTIGSSSVRLNPRVHIERLIFRGIYAARAETDERVRTGHQRKVELLRRCIRERALHLLFQPIVSQHADIIGYEALTRGRIAGLENPQILFDVAQSVGMVWDISREVRRLAFRELGGMPQDQLMFVNLHPIDFGDPHLARLETAAKTDGAEAASRIVFEITERGRHRRLRPLPRLDRPAAIPGLPHRRRRSGQRICRPQLHRQHRAQLHQVRHVPDPGDRQEPAAPEPHPDVREVRGVDPVRGGRRRCRDRGRALLPHQSGLPLPAGLLLRPPRAGLPEPGSQRPALIRRTRNQPLMA